MNNLKLVILGFFVSFYNTVLSEPLIELGFNSTVTNTGILSVSPTLMGNGDYVTDRFGYDCGALEFNGRSTYIKIPTTSELDDIQQFSVSVWLYIDKQKVFTQDDLSWLTLICKGDNTDEMISPQFRLQVTNATVSITSSFTEPASVPIPTDQWFCFVGTIDSSRIKLYIDNKIVYDEPHNLGQFQINRQPINIGRDVPGNVEYFSGIMDDFRLFNYALTESEVQYVAMHSVPFKEPIILPKSELSELYAGDNCKSTIDYVLPSLPHCMNGQWKSKGKTHKGSVVTLGEYVDQWEMDRGDTRIEISYKTLVRDSIAPGVENYTRLYLIADANGFAIMPSPTWKAKDNCKVQSSKIINGPVQGNSIQVGEYIQRIQVTDESGNSKEFSRSVIVESRPPSKPDPEVVKKTTDETTIQNENDSSQVLSAEAEPETVLKKKSTQEVEQFACPKVEDLHGIYMEASAHWDFESRVLDENNSITWWSAVVSKGGIKGGIIEEVIIDVEFSNSQKLMCRLNGIEITQDVIVSKKEPEPEPAKKDPPYVNDFETDIQKHFSANTSKITVFFVDSQFEDGDTINVYLNNTLVDKNVRLQNLKGGTKPISKWKQIRNLKPSIYTLQKGENILSLEAVNLGAKGKNTIKVLMFEGAVYDSKSFADSKFVELPFTVTSDIGTAGTIIIDL